MNTDSYFEPGEAWVPQNAQTRHSVRWSKSLGRLPAEAATLPQACCVLLQDRSLFPLEIILYQSPKPFSKTVPKENLNAPLPHTQKPLFHSHRQWVDLRMLECESNREFEEIKM